MKLSRYLAILVFSFVVLVSFIAITALSQEKMKSEGYVGSETCKACHEDLYNGFTKWDPHTKVVLDEKKGCEACHGPGEKHANSEGKEGFAFSFKSSNAQVRSGACLSCHKKNPSLFQAERSVHKLSAIACNDCHQGHGKKVTKKLLKQKDPALCFSCHADVKSKFYLSHSHPVLRPTGGGMTCSDCHTPHGTRTYANLRKINKFSKEDACFKCHPEKRGPFVFEHGARKFEGCNACHVPHGSPNRFLLTQSQIRLVCIQCHGQVHFPKIQCNNCHTQVHGSNFSSRFLQ
jgi:DmsE family decaheme c-type cytochrome